MPFDPTKPAANAPVSSAELRNQFNGLDEKIVALGASQVTWADLELVRQDVLTESAQAISNIAPLNINASEPPSAVELQAVIDKLNEVINGLKRS